MCGINGFFSKTGLVDAQKRLSRMNKSLIHRGPDAGEILVCCEGKVGMGHRRLSIIDLDVRSNQPMSNKSTIVYNGEIYNFKELRKEVNYTYKTNSDTEVLLVGLEKEGINFLRKCNGMFAFAFYDDKNKFMTLARDRLGIKPLYYYCDEENFVFSSEIKGILNSGLVKAEFNEDAIDEYLGNRYVREPYTFFKNIFQLPAGHYMTIDASLNIKIEKYWELPRKFNMLKEYNEEQIYKEFKEKVKIAIDRRLIADVPVGTYLSGGIDSGLITAIVAGKMENSINTYTVGFEELNEFSYARKVAQKYNTNHHEINMSQNSYFDLMEKVIKYKDAPLGVPNEVPLALMSKELKKDITVVLSGEGADELLGGYGRIFRSPFDYSNSQSKLSFYEYFLERYEYVPRRMRNQYLRTDHKMRDWFDEEIQAKFDNYLNEESVFWFFHSYHIKGLLQRLDTTTMCASVEARVPFLDHELLEFCYEKVPYELKIKWKSEEEKIKARRLNAEKYSEISDIPKYLLKRMGMEYLPQEVVIRKKMGFPVPLSEWSAKLKIMAQSLLRRAYWIEGERLDDLLMDCERNIRAGQLLWMFVNVEIFRKIYFDHEWRY